MIFETYYPLIITGGVLGTVSLIFIIAYALIKDKKESMGFDRNISDKEIVKRLLAYAKPYRMQFVLVLALMLFSISYDIIAPIVMGNIVAILGENFEMSRLLSQDLSNASKKEGHTKRNCCDNEIKKRIHDALPPLLLFSRNLI